MTFWLVIGAALFNLVNLGGMAYAVANGELVHTLTHVGLLVPSVFLVRLVAKRRAAHI
jgi:hypothetical protein